MLKYLAIALVSGILMSLNVFAETATFAVEGMSCGSCAKAVKAKVCGLPSIEKCDVQVGKVVLTSKNGEKIDLAEAQKLIEASGSYKVEKSSVKN